MKRVFYTLIVAVAGAMAVSCCCNAAKCCDADDNSAAVLETIMTRTSIRAFTDTPVEDEKIEQILRAGMAAPSAVNKQPWAFVVVNDREGLDRLREAHPHARMLSTAQAAIIVCGDMSKALEGMGRDFWIQDTSAATENILIAAHALGLGAVWTGVYPNPSVMPGIVEALELPSHIIPLNVIPIGYPAESPAPKDKWNPENIHYNKW